MRNRLQGAECGWDRVQSRKTPLPFPLPWHRPRLKPVSVMGRRLLSPSCLLRVSLAPPQIYPSLNGSTWSHCATTGRHHPEPRPEEGAAEASLGLLTVQERTALRKDPTPEEQTGDPSKP